MRFRYTQSLLVITAGHFAVRALVVTHDSMWLTNVLAPVMLMLLILGPIFMGLDLRAHLARKRPQFSEALGNLELVPNPRPSGISTRSLPTPRT